MNILAFDPSQEYTGYCILDVKKRQIIEYDCITILDLFYEETGKSIKQLKRSDAYVFRQQFALRFSQKISSIFEYNPDITEVALEFPHGSRNAKGAWGLGLSSGIISGIVINELGWKSYLLYSQSDAKEYMFNR
ncbi:MAG TPA: hypothetical protein VKA34_14215, partial [Balneolales bacterium]|nr:hypothetical protein [Balneolales bacterium]